VTGKLGQEDEPHRGMKHRPHGEVSRSAVRAVWGAAAIELTDERRGGSPGTAKIREREEAARAHCLGRQAICPGANEVMRSVARRCGPKVRLRLKRAGMEPNKRPEGE
jgi:hypothetical protein